MQDSLLFRMPLVARFLTLFCGLTLSTAVLASDTPHVSLKTSMGEIVLELDQEKAPKTVANFLQYVKSGYYKGLIFHRVINDFMIQGGGMDEKMMPRRTNKPVQNEAKNGLLNVPYSIAMARTQDPNSATSQFFINVAENTNLDYPGRDGFGYTVFGKVISGQDVVDKIKGVMVDDVRGNQNVPVTPIVIKSATIVKQ
ncbi:peptidyl-prolyl cis-trans isomerase [Massilia antarctica]|uniref:Peptidyl-prolyl cis-trans isomerase n=1 Tax=Massilia antarctica TaxID=2765360 RepID=A0AA48W8H9_9BURK|nr:MULTISPECIES: peptidylprolyl isomerase [Massilia]MCY0910681.1 peptidylprolyl isomerase [Massilia sp. H27-R4]QPI47982.1 peptidyl-prolyl cis-trans isomerase [Massilia antarctica]CUI08946.1 Peptidyl-prolyl cis-trans isomerase PpiA precursor [Janthinobacterium sp. CG23_2]CUU32732.1 Peptidyl-prolyl cis-trans isomerase PpiA precursor [Janthinobacterium sp. CG23_2]